ncbi:ABC transporter ATP-binding protein [Tumebacillus algifaecis]|uniref:ABC transporter ATP-binding protein n=1 Tax=Tumebacillus algifaecis TaxID=1214604 RepID=A0A223D000_9BACL|nr:ABC transporter ATP-binding protein [Tumebacillus algifaecis]ASS74687.1 ABC transporter ATP-binding protein [Tumebacillus algifaecis]
MSGQDQESVTLRGVFQAFIYWPRIFRLLWSVDRGMLISLLGWQLLQGIAPVAMLLATTHLINSVGESWEKGIDVLYASFVMFIIVVIVRQLISLVQGYQEGLFQTKLSNKINQTIIEKAVGLGLTEFENAEVQDQLKRAQQEASYRPYQIMKQMFSVITGVVTMLSAAGVLIAWKWWIAFVLILMPFASFISFLRLSQQQFEYEYHRAPLRRESWYWSYLLTNDKAVKEVRLYQLGDYLLNKYMDILMTFFRQDKLLARKRLLISLIFEGVSLTLTTSMVLLVLLSAFAKEILIGNVFGYVQAITLTQNTSQSVVQGLIQLCQNNLYIKQLFFFLDLDSAEQKQLSSARPEVPPLETVEFRNVTFRYPGRDVDALHNVSFTLHRGETLAVVGKNGSGKSTLVKVLTGLYPNYAGEILLNGEPLRSFDLDSLQRRVGVVFQDFMQYESDVRHNIGFGNLPALQEDDKIYHASEQAGIKPLLEAMPQHLDTKLGRWLAQGYQLSGGQWQRVAIARAFFREADLYLLDEPSSFLDPMAEADVFHKFQQLLDDRLGIFISHRYSSVRFADKIMVLDQGQVVEFGSHAELMAQDGMYAELYNMQVNAYLSDNKGGSPEDDNQKVAVAAD